MRRRFAEAALFNSCEENFPCTDTSCSLSYNYERCRDSCEYCGRCITCSSSSHSPSRLEAEEETVAFNETIKFCNEVILCVHYCKYFLLLINNGLSFYRQHSVVSHALMRKMMIQNGIAMNPTQMMSLYSQK